MEDLPSLGFPFTGTEPPIGLQGIEPRSHRYKQWALTNKQQSQENYEPSS